MQITFNHRWIIRAVIMVGLVLGIWHFRLALTSIFLFKAGEPVSSWLAMVTGPCLTLPAILLAIFKERIGGFLLIVGGLVSLIAMTIGEHLILENIVPFFYMISAPMVILGGALLITTNEK